MIAIVGIAVPVVIVVPVMMVMAIVPIAVVAAGNRVASQAP
jgi:hypothetical protein